MKRRRPLVLPLKRAFIIVLAVMHRGMSLNSLMELEHLSFVEVLERLANRANIPLPEAKLSPEQRARDERRKNYMKLQN